MAGKPIIWPIILLSGFEWEEGLLSVEDILVIYTYTCLNSYTKSSCSYKQKKCENIIAIVVTGFCF